MIRLSRAALIGVIEFLCACGGSSSTSPVTPVSAGSVRIKGEAWADNWFAMYVGEAQVAEDRIPITTERSFNAETFTFEGKYPFVVNLVIKDYKANDSGLEYIGQSNQQMGDGGFILQLTDQSTGKVVGATTSGCKCLVIHKAPLNVTCEKDVNPLLTCQFRSDPEPANWKSAGYDVSRWENATVYPAAQVGAKDGYNEIAWNTAAKLIWTSSLKQDNTLLCKFTVTGS